jgi:hypothetical protein
MEGRTSCDDGDVRVRIGANSARQADQFMILRVNVLPNKLLPLSPSHYKGTPLTFQCNFERDKQLHSYCLA